MTRTVRPDKRSHGNVPKHIALKSTSMTGLRTDSITTSACATRVYASRPPLEPPFVSGPVRAGHVPCKGCIAAGALPRVRLGPRRPRLLKRFARQVPPSLELISCVPLLHCRVDRDFLGQGSSIARPLNLR